MVFQGKWGRRLLRGQRQEPRRLRRGSGDDRAYTFGNKDTLRGGPGKDQLFGGAKDDYIDGGPGDKEFKSQLEGGSGNDTILGGEEADSIRGGDGSDTIYANGGDDYVHAGADNDAVYPAPRVSEGSDGIDGGTGYDVILFDDTVGSGLGIVGILPAKETKYGRLGLALVAKSKRDKVRGFESVYGSEGDDLLVSDRPGVPGKQPGTDIVGRGGNDSLVFKPGGSGRLWGGEGNDILVDANSGSDLFGESGNDVLVGNGGTDRLVGGPGADVHNGGNGFDTIDYSASSSQILVIGEKGVVGDAEGDHIESNIEVLKGTEAGDTLTGTEKSNYIYGLGGRDFINGAGGSDSLFGDAGEDTIITSGDGVGDDADCGTESDTLYWDTLDSQVRCEFRQVAQ